MKTKIINTTTKRGMNRLNMLIHAGKWRVVTAGKYSVTVTRS